MLDQQVGKKFDSQTRKTSAPPPENRTNTTITSIAGTTNNCIGMPDYFRSSVNKDADKEANRKLTKKIHNDFSNPSTGIHCFDGTFKEHVREGNHPYQVPPRKVAQASRC